MKRWLRIFYYLGINIVVSTCTVLLVLMIWDRNRPDASQVLTPVVITQVVVATAPSSSSETAAEGAVDEPARYETYIVRSGDTLGSIADEFDTTIEDLIALNSLTNPNALEVGQVLLLPGLLPTQTPTPGVTDIPKATATLPAPLPPAPTGTLIPADAVVPIEIVTVIGAGVLMDERILIRYTGEGSISLAGWRLQAPGGDPYQFPQVVLFKDGTITVYTRSGVDSALELYWGLGQSVWQSGDRAVLYDSAGQARAETVVP